VKIGDACSLFNAHEIIINNKIIIDFNLKDWELFILFIAICLGFSILTYNTFLIELAEHGEHNG